MLKSTVHRHSTNLSSCRYNRQALVTNVIHCQNPTLTTYLIDASCPIKHLTTAVTLEEWGHEAG